MPENPLLPHRKLRQLHGLMMTCRALERRHGNAGREAVLAATTMQLLEGDLVCGGAGDAALAELAPHSRQGVAGGGWVGSSLPCLPVAAALARGLQACVARSKPSDAPAAERSLVLALAQAGSAQPGWAEALEWAHKEELPLVLVCTDGSGAKWGGGKPARLGAARLDWAAVSRLAKRLRLPILTVDGEDAVAVYRVMQESALRARSGLGPAVIWAVLSAQRPAGAANPLARLRRYLAVRGITLSR